MASDPTSTWPTFTSPKLGYTIKYPPNLRYIGSVTSGPDPADAFSNEGGDPYKLDANGVLLEITVNHDSGDVCLKHDLLGSIDRQVRLVLDGTSSTLYILTWNYEEGVAPVLIVNVLHGAYCYEIVFLTRNAQLRDSYGPIALLMLGRTFRFGNGPA